MMNKDASRLARRHFARNGDARSGRAAVLVLLLLAVESRAEGAGSTSREQAPAPATSGTRAPSGAPPRAGLVLAQFAGGWALASIAGMAWASGGGADGLCFSDCYLKAPGLSRGDLPGLGGLAAGTLLGVSLIGAGQETQGSFTGTLIGTGVGLLPAALFLQLSDSNKIVTSMPLFAGITVLGGVLGHHWGRWQGPQRTAAAAGLPSLQLAVSASGTARHAALLGIF